MKRMAFIAPLHHRQTGSSKHIINFLSPFFDIDIYWDKSNIFEGTSKFNLASINKEKYDLLFIYKISEDLKRFSTIQCPSIICTPKFPLNDCVVNSFPNSISGRTHSYN